MHMMIMLAILCAVFFVALFLMCFFREKLTSRIFNPLFLAVCAVCFFCWNYAAYERGWLEDGFMTLENISPFICTLILFTPFLSEKIKEYAYSAIAFLAFGMFLAMLISPEASYLLDFYQEANFMHVSEAACHLVMALYGFYLILSDKVPLGLRSFCKSVIFMFSVIGFGVFLNLFFHRENFGMNMYGSYSIYFLDIFGNFEITLLAYLLGVLGVLALGFLVGIFLDRLSRTPAPETTDPELATEPEAVASEITEPADESSSETDAVATEEDQNS